MRQPHWRKLATLVVLAPLAIVLMAAAPNASAQERKPETKSAVKPNRREAGKAAKPQGRIPAYYAQVITEEQKQRIYEIQAKHAEQIKTLQKELDELRKSIDTEIEALLTSEQKQQVTELQTAAKAKRKEASKTVREQKRAETKPAAK